MDTQNTPKKSNKLIMGLLIGSAVGAAVGVALAPEPGEVTRKKIKESAQKVMDTGKKVIDDHGEDVVQGAKTAAKGSGSILSKIFSAIKESVKEGIDEVK
ncbi:MAG: YtxH domain-containing protein [Patescibacteria group bacterium]|nr:YtxH domain-containing protein [Patescibacteria group bacterium]